MDIEKLLKRIKLQSYIFFLNLYVQLLRYFHTLCKPVEWVEARIRDYQIKKLEKDLRRMEKEAEEEYGKGKS